MCAFSESVSVSTAGPDHSNSWLLCVILSAKVAMKGMPRVTADPASFLKGRESPWLMQESAKEYVL